MRRNKEYLFSVMSTDRKVQSLYLYFWISAHTIQQCPIFFFLLLSFLFTCEFKALSDVGWLREIHFALVIMHNSLGLAYIGYKHWISGWHSLISAKISVCSFNTEALRIICFCYMLHSSLHARARAHTHTHTHTHTH